MTTVTEELFVRGGNNGFSALDDGPASLIFGFAAPDQTVWRALVDKTLNGASFEKRLVSRTYDGIGVQPLYTAANSAPPMADPLRRKAQFDDERAWDIRAIVDHPDPAAANALLLADLEGGASSLLVKIDPSGHDGVAVASAADFSRLMDGVLFDLAPVALDAGFLGPTVGKWLGDLAQSKTLKPHLHLHLDPIGTFMEAGVSPGPLQAHIEAAAEVAAAFDVDSSFLASGRVVHEAGGSEAQELGVMVAIGLAYVKAMTAAGRGVDKAMAAIVLGVAADAEYFTTIAKIRAAKAVWARVAAALSPTNPQIRIEARSSRRMLSTLDPWVNMLRLTSAAVGAALGGADAVVLDPFTQPLGRPTEFARRQARNIQLVLMEEAQLGRVSDSAGGAWFVEALTDDLARAAWAVFQTIEKQGGILSALSCGAVADAVGIARHRRQNNVAKRKAGLVGVSEFPSLVQAAVEIDVVDETPFAKPGPSARQDGPDDGCPPLKPWRSSQGIEALRLRADALAKPPLALLATIGSARDHAARVGFSRNLLAVGGVDCDVVNIDDATTVAFPLAVICGSDQGYAERGVEAAQLLKTRGAKTVLLAGRPSELEPELRSSGVDGFVFAGEDVEAALDRILTLFEE